MLKLTHAFLIMALGLPILRAIAAAGCKRRWRRGSDAHVVAVVETVRDRVETV